MCCYLRHVTKISPDFPSRRRLSSPACDQPASGSPSIEKHHHQPASPPPPQTPTQPHIIRHASQRIPTRRPQRPRPVEHQLRPQRHQRALEPRKQERRCRCLLLCCKRYTLPLVSQASPMKKEQEMDSIGDAIEDGGKGSGTKMDSR